jgi:hypothetical protein
MLSINTITIEGPDLSGKSTLYESLHESTNFRWNIQDRSEFSMLCYSILYARPDQDVWRSRLIDSINNLNNRIIVLLPTWDELERRYAVRGDERQSIDGLRKLYDIFSHEAEKLSCYSTVFVIYGNPSTPEMVDFCTDSFIKTENCSIDDVSLDILNHVNEAPNQECSPVRFNLDLTGKLSDVDPDIMNHESESKYYRRILSGVLSNIDCELIGYNDDNLSQNAWSTRRFIFTNDSCISLIHTMPREDTVAIHVVCRSSNVFNVFRYDLNFLHYLSSRICDRLGAIEKSCMLRVTMNSAHIP